MRSTIRHRRYRKLPAIAILLILAIALATPLLAHDRRSRGHRRHHHESRHHASHRHVSNHDHGSYRGRFVIPSRIDRRHVEAYQPYYWTRVYDRGHRHHHAVYRFPVYTPYGVFYEPYAYCEGRLFHDGVQISYHGRHVAFSVGF